MAKATENTKNATRTEVSENTEVAESVKADDGRVDYVLPKNLLTDEKGIEVCLNGKVYQVPCGVKVRIPRGVAEILDNSIAQHEKVEAMKSARGKNTPELTN